MVDWIGVIQETLMITSFVIIMMFLIEFINVISRGTLEKLLNKNSYIQIIAGALFGIIPGCMGTFAIVSLYSQKLLSFGALISTMIATSGDEAFFMLAVVPKDAVILFIILFIIALVTGILIDKFFKRKTFISDSSVVIDNSHDDGCEVKLNKVLSFKNFNFNQYRVYLILIISAIIILSFIGCIGHSHSEASIFNINYIESVHSDVNTHNHDEHHYSHDNCEHAQLDSHNHSMHTHSHGEADVVKIIIIACAFILLLIVLFCDDHFVKDHLWNHVIKKHLPKIFLWIFGTLIIINFAFKYIDISTYVSENLYVLLLIAVLIGIIPQSGPHLVFVVFYTQGIIPFSILIANSIVQDGHGALPLLAESKKSFIVMKTISVAIGLLFGCLGLLIGF